MEEPPTIKLLFLGEPDVGKSTFFSRVSIGTRSAPSQPLPVLRDSAQPFVFDLRTRKHGALRLEVFDTASPEHYTRVRADMLVLCYSVVDRESLTALKTKWKYLVETHFNYDERMPVMVLGLKRDARKLGDADTVEPQEGLGVAQGMRCDRYAECSAVTGELVKEAWEDVVGMAVGTREEGGGKAVGAQCAIL